MFHQNDQTNNEICHDHHLLEIKTGTPAPATTAIFEDGSRVRRDNSRHTTRVSHNDIN
jgi:hypothetical protein